MSTVFDKIGDVRNDVRRNTFDWSKANNFTTALGRITPVYCELCPPNSSLRIKPDYGLRMMPMMFPVQTRIKAMLSFFRVPLRTLWKDYKDWISSPNDADSKLEPPFMSFPSGQRAYEYSQILGISGLADYLGIPVALHQTPFVVFDSEGLSREYPDDNVAFSYVNDNTKGLSELFAGSSNIQCTKQPFSNSEALQTLLSGTNPYFVASFPLASSVDKPDGRYTANVSIDITFGVPYVIPETGSFSDKTLPRANAITTARNSRSVLLHESAFCYYDSSQHHVIRNQGYKTPVSLSADSDTALELPAIGKPQYDPYLMEGTFNGQQCIYFRLRYDAYLDITVESGKPKLINFTSVVPAILVPGKGTGVNGVYDFVTLDAENTDFFVRFKAPQWFISQFVVSNFSLSDETTPYYTQAGNNANRLKVSAYPFRAYEAVYNAYIRNNKNNPFMLDGKPAYNVWIPNNDGGEDKIDYQLHYANWFSDMFTTAVPSPQQGKAPLVGITTYTEDVILDNGHKETTLKTAIVDEEGNKYGVSFESNGEALKGVKYKMLSSDTPVAPVSLFDLASSGISINDFRNVNAYQRYLELNQMRGFSYKDIIEGRFDVNVRYDDLNMPEYLGGCTRDVNVNPVTQVVDMNTSGSYSGALGSQAGNATLFAGSEDISVFCDEESIVIGVLSIVPCPVYSQAIPKWMLYHDRLDSFNPEFDHIGFQPIRVKEIAPIQQFVEDPTKMDDVFGYQRPWYEYCQKLDTVSGLFRTQLRNFLINRIFATVPKLNSAFTTVDPDEVNDVFAVTETTDKILGLIYFDVVAKLPISRVVVPRLE